MFENTIMVHLSTVHFIDRKISAQGNRWYNWQPYGIIQPGISNHQICQSTISCTACRH